MSTRRSALALVELLAAIVFAALGVTILVGAPRFFRSRAGTADGGVESKPASPASSSSVPRRLFEPRRQDFDTSGFSYLASVVRPWKADASLEEIREVWHRVGYQGVAHVDKQLATADRDKGKQIRLMFMKACFLNSEAEADKAYQVLEQLRSSLESADGHEELASAALGTLICFQGVTALRRGENDNCIMCRGESSCILPISPAAVHTNPTGSRLAIKHFTEYLDLYPNDLEIQYLLNIAHMTLGEYPDKVDPTHRLNLDRFFHSEFNIGKFRDVGHLVGVNRYNQAGGAIMEDFDNDGLLDLAISSLDPTQRMSYYRNKGDSTFEDRSQEAGVTDQLGGLVCYQADYNNDGRMDIYIPRGAWLTSPIRPTLLRNNGAGGFNDVTKEANLLDPLNSNAAAWADYDNDGWVDLFVGAERQYQRLYHNKGNGTFEEVAAKAGVRGEPRQFCKGCTWIDFDNDGYPDLFQNNLHGSAILHRNNRNGTFTDVSSSMDIDGPFAGFSCWTWDYDNDGWQDIFATSYDRTIADIVRGMMGLSHSRYSNRLFRNLKGKGFENVTGAAGLDHVFATMGSNYGDFDNDGYLDMYLGTGAPNLSILVPNRMFKNVGGERFAEITASSGTGNLQKGHGVACGDWDRDGDVDLFVQMGGAVNGDKYHNILFQNPGQGNHWLTVKLVGKKTNRAALGARIKVVTAGEKPLTVHRHVSAGSSFGANTLQQTVGLAKAERVALLEIRWPTSGTTQVFRDIAVDQAIEVTEFARDYQPLNWKPIPQPQ
jgi:FG-GAP-like repeat/ASPIC and UnbV